MPTPRSSLFPLALLACAACSSTTPGGGGDGGSSSESATNGSQDAYADCIEVADAVGQAAARCGASYGPVRKAFLENAVGGDCRNVKAIRDEASLKSICIPSWSTESCADLQAGKYDPSCAGQLLH